MHAVQRPGRRPDRQPHCPGVQGARVPLSRHQAAAAGPRSVVRPRLCHRGARRAAVRPGRGAALVVRGVERALGRALPAAVPVAVQRVCARRQGGAPLAAGGRPRHRRARARPGLCAGLPRGRHPVRLRQHAPLPDRRRLPVRGQVPQGRRVGAGLLRAAGDGGARLSRRRPVLPDRVQRGLLPGLPAARHPRRRRVRLPHRRIAQRAARRAATPSLERRPRAERRGATSLLNPRPPPPLGRSTATGPSPTSSRREACRARSSRTSTA